jgi:uncharacterized protein
LDLLILYSETKKGEVVSLASLLHEKGIRFRPLLLPRPWEIQESEDFYHYLMDTSHWLFLVSAEDLSNQAFLFASGFCVSVHERCYLLAGEGAPVPGYWKALFHICEDFSSLVDALEDEKKRWAVFLLRLEAKKKLEERGLEVSNSAFIEAVERGDLVSCELFLQAGFSPDLNNKKGVSILCLAVRLAHMGVLRLLLDGGADMNLHSKDRDNSPLMDASAEGLAEMVQELVGRGASLEGLSRNGQNALVLAIGKGAQDVAAILLDAGGDPFIADKLGMNACQYAQLLGRAEFLERVKVKYPDRV